VTKKYSIPKFPTLIAKAKYQPTVDIVKTTDGLAISTVRLLTQPKEFATMKSAKASRIKI